MKYSFIFICQKGELEIKSVLLALSLKKHLKCDYELIAAIPELYGEIQEPDPFVINLFKQLNIRIEYFKNEFCINKEKYINGDLISNKIYCLRIPFYSDKIIFLDSDMLCLKNFTDNSFFHKIIFGAKQVNYPNVREWDKIYNLFGIKKPEERIPCSVSSWKLPPYFNSGFIIIDHSIINMLYSIWVSLFISVSQKKTIDKNLFNPFNRDQVSLALAVQKLNITYNLLDNTYNFPAKSIKVTKSNLPVLAHYHGPFTIYRIPRLKKDVQSYFLIFPQIIQLIKTNEKWNRIFFGNYFKKVKKGIVWWLKNQIIPKIKIIFKKMTGMPLSELDYIFLDLEIKKNYERFLRKKIKQF